MLDLLPHCDDAVPYTRDVFTHLYFKENQ